MVLIDRFKQAAWPAELPQNAVLQLVLPCTSLWGGQALGGQPIFLFKLDCADSRT